MRINRPTAILASAAVLLAGAVCGGCGGLGHGDSDVTGTAKAFLAAWQSGDLGKAAHLTTSPEQAETELQAYRKHTDVTSVTFTPGTAHGDTVPFMVKAHVAHNGTEATWTYTSRLDVSGDPGTGEPRVAWRSSVIHPALPDGGGYWLQTSTQPEQPVVTDRHGSPLTADDHPGLRQIISQLDDRYADTGTGRQTLGVRLASYGDGDSGRTVATLETGKARRLRTSIDADVQHAVDAAAADHAGASLVVIQPSTGDILAAAAPPGRDNDPTLEGVQAPGQVFELVTAAALLENHQVSPATHVSCPSSVTAGGATFSNPDAQQPQGRSFSDAFVHACDTSFLQLAQKITGRQLADEAHDVFGLGLDWQTGVTSVDGAVPDLGGTDKLKAAIGQGEVRLNTLNLASIGATIQSGHFKQPLLVDAKTSGKTVARTDRPLSAQAATALRTLMRGYAHNAGIDGLAYGGVADLHSDAPQPVVGWFTAINGDIAVAASTPESTHQPKAAGDTVRAVLKAVEG